MATVTIQATNICSGGDHVTITGSISGGPSKSVIFHVNDLISAIDDIGVGEAILAIIRIHSIGKTLAQVKSDLQTGTTVTI